MGSADPIFVFKQHFKREEADRFVASIIQHKLVWERLIDEKFLNELIAAFSNKQELWTAAHICLYASGFTPHKTDNLKQEILGNKSIIQDSGAKTLIEPSIEQLTFNALGILIDKQSGKGWSEILESLNDARNKSEDINSIEGTVFSIVYLLTDERAELIKALGDSNERHYQNLLAFLIGCNPELIQIDSSEFLDWVCEIPAKKFNQLMEDLLEYTEKTVIAQLADAYLERNPITQKLEKYPHSASKTDGLIEKIRLNKDYALLARFGSDSHLSEEYSKEASKFGEQLNQSLEKLSNNLNSIQDREGKFGDITSLSDILGSEHIAIKFLRIVEIRESDIETAMKLGRDARNIILQSSSIRQIVPSVESADVLDTEEIIQLFLSLGMIVEASEVAEKFVELQPRNFELIKQSASLFFNFGDDEKAVKYLERFNLSKNLTREEELILIEAYTNQGLWQNALDVWKKINLVSLEDYQKKAICAYHVNDHEDFEETEKACKNFYQPNGIFGVIRGLFALRNGQTGAAQAEIEAVLSNRKRDRFTIQYIIEYYLAVSQPEKALAWINSLSSLEKNFPEVRLMQYKTLKQMSDKQGCKKVISSFASHNLNSSLPIVEKIINECILQKDLPGAENILKTCYTNWPLSPNLDGYRAHLLIESGKFSAAQDLLIKLIRRKDTKEDWIVDYALSKIERKHNAFPMGESTLELDSTQKLFDFEKRIFKKYPENIFLRIICAEIEKNDRLDAYQEILADKRVHHHPEIWRVHAGMGKHYFQNKKFDMALVSFKEARKQQPRLKVINLYLINALAKMKLSDDALKILSASISDNQFSLQELLEINTNMKHSEQWLRMLKSMVDETPNSTRAKIILAQLYVEKKKNDKAYAIIGTIKFTRNSELLERLVCTQILIQAGFIKEAKHMLEYLLTSKKEIGTRESLAGTFLYMQMQEFHKAANLLNLNDESGYIENALKSDLYMKLGLLKESEVSIQAAIGKLEESDYGWTNNLIPWITKPDIWEILKTDKVWIYLKSIEASLLNKDYDGALEKATNYIKQYPSDLRLSSMALNIVNLFGDGQDLDALLDKLPEDLTNHNISDGVCVYGELALRKGHEIMAANLVSQCLERFPDSPRVKALQARLLARNGNCKDAEILLDELLNDASKKTDSEDDVLSRNQLWLAEAALELGKENIALNICGNIFSECGIAPECTRVFLSSILNLAVENWINKKLNVTQHNETINSQVLKYFDDIRIIADEKIKGNRELQGLIASVKIWLDLLNGNAVIETGLESAGLEKNAQLAVRLFANSHSKTEITYEEESCEGQDKFLMVLFLIESQPDKAVEYLSQLIRISKQNPRYYAALAFIKKGMGRFDDAYAAINLALAEWEEEYKWQILAGELSQAMGDMHASLAHYQKAAEIHKDEETQSYLGKINYQAGNRFGISFLENKLTGRSEDLETLINLGELSLKTAKYQKAAKYLEKAIKIDPNDTRSFVLLSKVALKVGNLDKAQEIIDQAAQIDPEEIDIALQRIDIEENKNGARNALDWIESNIESKTCNAWQVVIRKADLLAAIHGNQAALKFLHKQKEKHTNASLDMRIAQLYLEAGNLNQAEEAAEQVLHSDSNNPTAMSLLAKIFSQSGDLDKAIDFLIKAIQMNPFAVNYYIELAKIHQTRRELDQAAVVLQNGLRSNPMNFDLLFALGLLYYQQGLYKRSEEYLKQASSIDQSNENVKRLLSTLMNANIIQPEKFKVNAIRMN